jgi:hypothetical protein
MAEFRRLLAQGPPGAQVEVLEQLAPTAKFGDDFEIMR